MERAKLRANNDFDTPDLRFIVDQRVEYRVLSSIRNFLGAGGIYLRHGQGNMWRYHTQSACSHQSLQDYLRRHPLRGEKRLHALDFFRLRRYCNERQIKPWRGAVGNRVKRLMLKIQSKD